MKTIKKILKVCGITILTIALLAGLADATWVFVPQFLSAHKIADTNALAKNIEDLSIPNSTKVIAFGEATHGNKEFQELKLDVLKLLVNTSKVRSFALEADWGEGMAINNYIHGGNGNVNELVKSLSFSIYHTQEIADLIQWMMEYNDRASENEKLNFYGFDMQDPDKDLGFIVDFCKKNDILPDVDLEHSLLPITKENSSRSLDTLNKISSIITEKYSTKAEQAKAAPYLQAVNVFIQSIEYYEAMISDPMKSFTLRDEFMAKNVQWIQEYEENRGNSQILISAHNGHISFSLPLHVNMGHKLKEEYKDGYFAIGSDFYNTSVNVPDLNNNRTRTIADFCSSDILAYQAKYHNNKYLLQFSDTAGKDDKISSLINSPLNMGSLGEEYYFCMNFLPTTYIIRETPTKLYNAMIFLYETTPIDILE